MEAFRINGGNRSVEAIEQSLGELDVGDNAGRIKSEDYAVALLGQDILAVFLLDLGGCTVLLAILGFDVRKIQWFIFLIIEGKIERRLLELG